MTHKTAVSYFFVYSNRHVVKISLPILLSLLAQNIIQVIDTAFLGRVGEVELGASALAGIIYIAIYTIGFGFSMGSQILIGRRNGDTVVGMEVLSGKRSGELGLNRRSERPCRAD